MKEQQYILKNVKSFEPKHIFECGQCFRWKPGFVYECVLKVDNFGGERREYR